MSLKLSANKAVGPVSVHLGPFKDSPATTSIVINGKHPDGASVSHSGDSYWVTCRTNLGPAPPRR